MRRIIGTSLILVCLGSIILWIGCSMGASGGTSAKGSADTEYIHAAATAESREEQMAIDKAKHEARVKIAQQIDARIQQLLEETGDSETPVAASEGSASEMILRRSKVSNQKIEKDGGIYRVYVLVKMPAQEADCTLVAKVKENKDLYVRLRESEKFRKLEKQVEEYEQNRN